jgi:HlyD family secretion protein
MTNQRVLLTIAALLQVLAIVACSSRSKEYQGYVEGEFLYISSSQAGRLDHLSVARGQQVDAGAQLFALEATVETAEQQQAQHQLASAEAQLADLQSGKRAPEVAVVRAQLEQARASAEKSSLQRGRDEAQYRAGGISREQLQATLAAATSDAARVTELQSQVKVAELPGRAQQLTAQQNQVQAARAVLAQADWRLDQKTLSAPKAGLVYDTMYREGEWVSAGSPVVRMLPPQNIKVRFFVSETVLGALSIGQHASVHCDGCAAEVPVTVTYISQEAEYTPPVIYSNDTRSKLVYLVEAHPTAQDAVKLHPGQPLSLRLQ